MTAAVALSFEKTSFILYEIRVKFCAGLHFIKRANNWEAPILNDWGLGVWNAQTPNTDFAPSVSPVRSTGQISDSDFQKGSDGVGANLKMGTEREFIETMCPECGHEFNVAKE